LELDVELFHWSDDRVICGVDVTSFCVVAYADEASAGRTLICMQQQARSCGHGRTLTRSGRQEIKLIHRAEQRATQTGRRDFFN